MKRIILICIISAFYLSVNLFGQSRYLEDGISGPGLTINAGVNDYKFTTIGMAASYSIGGIMDFGVLMNRVEGTLYDTARTDIDFNFIYNLIVVKQSEYTPFNVQLEGTYGYTNVNSDYLDFFKFQRTGQGFTIGMSVFSDLALINHLDFLIGVKGFYRNYLFTLTDISNPDVPVVDSLERAEELKMGVLAAVSLKLDNWLVIALGTDLLYSIMESGVSVIPTLSVISPMH